MINRSSLLRTVSQKCTENRGLKTLLSANWYGSLDQVLFPLDAQFYDDGEYRNQLARATNMKELYHVIREQTDDMFDILSLEYVIYTPGRGTGWEEPKEA
jgi:hypothetical protein